jgi:hypothetical protein
MFIPPIIIFLIGESNFKKGWLQLSHWVLDNHSYDVRRE